MNQPTTPIRWQLVRSTDPRWFHSTGGDEINFHPNGSVTFTCQGRHLAMACLTLTSDELSWLQDYRDWLGANSTTVSS